MARKVPHNFLETGEQTLVNVDLLELADGSGIVTLYGALNQSGANLTRNTNTYCDLEYTNAAFTSTEPTYTKEIDLDFDYTVNLPFRLKGKMLVNCGIEGIGAVGAGNKAYAIVKLRQVRDGVESDIGSGTSRTVRHEPTNHYVDVANTRQRSRIVNVEIDVPLTLYKIGDTLRVTVEIWGAKIAGATGSPEVRVFHDPKGRTGRSNTDANGDEIETSQLIVNLPLRIDR